MRNNYFYLPITEAWEKKSKKAADKVIWACVKKRNQGLGCFKRELIFNET